MNKFVDYLINLVLVAAIGLILLFVLGLLGFFIKAHAAGSEHQWWECQHNGTILCCSIADGHAISPIDWRTVGDHYEVQIESRWWPVPNDKIINPADQCGVEPNEETRALPKVWYSYQRALTGEISNIWFYCAMRGVEE